MHNDFSNEVHNGSSKKSAGILAGVIAIADVQQYPDIAFLPLGAPTANGSFLCEWKEPFTSRGGPSMNGTPHSFVKETSI